MYKVKEYVPLSCLRQLYFSLVYPYLVYCVNVWGGTYPEHLRPLTVLQKRAVRLISNSQYLAHTNPLFRRHNILKLCDIYKLNVATYFHKNKLYKYFNSAQSYDTRSSNNLVPTFQSTTVTQQSINYIGPMIWEKIPNDIRSLNCLNSSKRATRSYYISKYPNQ